MLNASFPGSFNAAFRAIFFLIDPFHKAWIFSPSDLVSKIVSRAKINTDVIPSKLFVAFFESLISNISNYIKDSIAISAGSIDASILFGVFVDK